MSFSRFFPFRDDYYYHDRYDRHGRHGRHHEEGIVNNLIVNVQEEYRPHIHYFHPHHHYPFWTSTVGEPSGGGIPGSPIGGGQSFPPSCGK
jgi:hypothetical protein